MKTQATSQKKTSRSSCAKEREGPEILLQWALNRMERYMATYGQAFEAMRKELNGDPWKVADWLNDHRSKLGWCFKPWLSALLHRRGSYEMQPHDRVILLFGIQGLEDAMKE